MDLHNPLFLHPSDGRGSMPVTEKLQGSGNYRPWRRSVEINLATKRKLGFLNGSIQRSTEDPAKADQWDACNSMVIAWLMNSVSDTIARSVLYVETAHAIWTQLERRFALSNGSRKYKLNREIYILKKSEMSINDYFTKMQMIWEELDAMEVLQSLNNVTSEMLEYLKCIEKYKEEQKLFQFLNGLDETYTAQRSHVLQMTPLPSAEAACNMMQQEEAQREVLRGKH